MTTRKKRRHSAYWTVKSRQRVTGMYVEKVHDWDIDEMSINVRSHIVDRKRRFKVGYVQNNGGKSR